MAESLANRLSNPNCVGENISPQLSWSNVPDGTKSFILLMSDPEGRGAPAPVILSDVRAIPQRQSPATKSRSCVDFMGIT